MLYNKTYPRVLGTILTVGAIVPSFARDSAAWEERNDRWRSQIQVVIGKAIMFYEKISELYFTQSVLLFGV